MQIEEIIIKRKQRDNRKGNLKQRKKDLLKDIISYVKSGESVEYKKQVQELYWKYRKEGLDSKEAWNKAKEEAILKVKD